MNTYTADDIEVLVLSYEQDSVGMVIPPEAHIVFPKNIKVTYGEEDKEMDAGKALLRRVGNTIYADLVLKSPMDNTKEALRLLKKLYPAVAFYIKEYHNNTVLKLEISEVFLTPYPNDNSDIKKLGKRIGLLPNKKDLH